MKEIVDRLVEAEVDRTKARWVAGVYREFRRPKTTVAALYYFALGRGGGRATHRPRRPATPTISPKKFSPLQIKH